VLARWVLPIVTVVLILGLLGTPLYNADGQTCGTITIVALDPNYYDGEDGGYPDDNRSCHRAAQPRGLLAVVVAVTGGLGTRWVIRRASGAPDS
jgi:hypothetical protein